MLEKIEDYYNEGEYSVIIETLEKFIKSDSFTKSPNDVQLLYYYYLIQSYNNIGDDESALLFIKKAKEKYSFMISTDGYLPLVVAESNFYFGKSVNEGINLCKKFLESKDNMYTKQSKWYVLLVRNYAVLLDYKGLLSESIEMNTMCLRLGSNILSNLNLMSIYSNMGGVYCSKGEYDNGLLFFNKALDLIKENKNIPLKVTVLINVGEVYYIKGNFTKSLEFLKEGLKLIDNGKYEDLMILELLLLLLKCYLELKDVGEAEAIIKKIEQLHEEKTNLTIDYYYKLTKAIYLMNNEHIRTKFKALPIFESLLNHGFQDNQYRIAIIGSICELNFLMLKAYNDKDLLMETMQMVNNYYDQAQTKESYHEIVEMLILKSKLNLLDNNYVQAEKCLYQALLSAEDHELGLLKKKIEQESLKLKLESDKWTYAYSKGYDYTKKLDMLQMESYLKEIQKYKRG